MVVLAVDSSGATAGLVQPDSGMAPALACPGDRSRIAVGDKFLRLGFRALIHQVPGVGVALQYR